MPLLPSACTFHASIALVGRTLHRLAMGRLSKLRPTIATMLLLTLAGCLTPPAVLPGGLPQVDIESAGLPPDSEIVEVLVEPGVLLRGAFCPADDGAPVVLHLLESGGSVTANGYGMRSGGGSLFINLFARDVLWELADLGYASLILDYEGVGASDGERDPAHLARDARAAWDEAVRRAGSAERVVVRATSLGCLALATLLDAGLQPAGAVLVAPVRPDTVTRRFGRILLGPVLTFLLAPLYRDVVDLDLAGTLGDSLAPLLVYSSVEDELLPPEDAAPVRAAVERAGGRWVDGPGSGMLLSTMHMKKHVQLAMTGRSLMPNEAEILREWLPPSPDVATRLQHVLSKFSEDELTRVRNASRGLSALQDMVAVRRNDNPTHLAALALTNNRREGNLQLLDMLRQDRTGWLDEVSLDEMQLRLDMSDPAGAVPVSRVRALLDMLKPWRAGGHAEDPLAALTQVVEWTRGLGIAGMTEVSRNMTPPQLGYSYSLDLRSSLWNRVARDDLSDADVARLVQRVLLKAIGLQERVVIDEQGRMLIEVSLPDGPRRIDPETVLKSAQP